MALPLSSSIFLLYPDAMFSSIILLLLCGGAIYNRAIVEASSAAYIDRQHEDPSHYSTMSPGRTIHCTNNGYINRDKPKYGSRCQRSDSMRRRMGAHNCVNAGGRSYLCVQGGVATCYVSPTLRIPMNMSKTTGIANLHSTEGQRSDGSGLGAWRVLFVRLMP